MANSKRKGNKFELKISKWFTQWTGFKFERNRAGSGAWHSNKDSVSDISCTDEKHAHRCKISVECKSYKEINFEHVLLGNKHCDILKFWEQATTDAKRAGRIPILCMRYNSMPSEEFFFVVQLEIGEKLNQLIDRCMTLEYHGTILYVFMASDVIQYVDYKALHKFCKYLLKL
jgi:hypothetical protein